MRIFGASSKRYHGIEYRVDSRGLTEEHQRNEGNKVMRHEIQVQRRTVQSEKKQEASEGVSSVVKGGVSGNLGRPYRQSSRFQGK